MMDSQETPFAYQVAGHGALLNYGKGKICKPLIPREFTFYETLQKSSSDLAFFTAVFYGTVDLSFSSEQLSQWKQKVEEAEKDDNGKGSFDDVNLHPWSAKV